MPHSILRNPLTAAAAVLACLSLAFSAQAAEAQTLAGEHVERENHIESFTIDGTCNADGPSTFTYSIGGPATGPIPGSYNGYGEFTLASPTGPVTSFSEAFTLYTDDADVLGSHALGDSVEAWCTPGDQLNLEVEVNTAYAVTDPFTETGPANVRMTAVNGWPGVYDADFGEQTPPPPPPPPTAPKAKADCFDGKWRTWTTPRFKNQGDCISYVVHLNRAV